jgi:hypothetical protein
MRTDGSGENEKRWEGEQTPSESISIPCERKLVFHECILGETTLSTFIDAGRCGR